MEHHRRPATALWSCPSNCVVSGRLHAAAMAIHVKLLVMYVGTVTVIVYIV